MAIKKVTYKDIQDYIKEKYNRTIKTCAIASARRKLGFNVRKSWNSGTAKNAIEATPEEIDIVKEAYIHYGVAIPSV